MLKSTVIQNAIEELVVNQQDNDTVRLTFLQAMKATKPSLSEKEKGIRVKLERPDRDSINSGPVVDNGDGTYTYLTTVQVTFSFDECLPSYWHD